MNWGSKSAVVGVVLFATLASFARPGLADPAAELPASIAEGVDKLLADQLFDPTTAIQYRVSAPVSCKSVMDGLPEGSMCVCYAVNAKNRYGAYVGATMYAAPFMDIKGRYLVLPGFEIEGAAAGVCEKSGLQVRPASKIAERASK